MFSFFYTYLSFGLINRSSNWQCCYY